MVLRWADSSVTVAKMMKTIGKYLLVGIPWAVLIFGGALYLLDRSLSFPWVWREVGRVAAPSAPCELVTYQGNRGAMSSWAYVSFLVPPGGKADPNAVNFYVPILSTTHTAPKPRWENNGKVIIDCERGYVTHLRPYSREFNVVVEVTGYSNPPPVPGR